MIEREVTDLINITLSVFLLSLIVNQPSYNFEKFGIDVVALLFIIISCFSHLILRQLKYLKSNHSLYFSYISLISFLLLAIRIFANPLSEIEGFWEGIPNGFKIAEIISLGGLMISSLFSFNATLINE